MKNSSILDEIVAYKLDEVARAKKQVSQSDLENRASSQESVRGFKKALSEEILASQPAVIAEIKKHLRQKVLLGKILILKPMPWIINLAGQPVSQY